MVRSPDRLYEFVLGGVPLWERLRKHERLSLRDREYVCALGTVEQARARLLLEEPPDLFDGHTALFVCGHCGGYDGSPLGARIRRDGDRVVWDRLGFHTDLDEPSHISLFERVTSFSFDWSEYRHRLLGTAES